jgi:hypothetical protein
MRNRSYKANTVSNSKSNSKFSNSNQIVTGERSNGILVRTLKGEHDTTAPAVGLKCKKNSLERAEHIEIEIQNVVHGLVELKIVISVKGSGKEDSARNISIKGQNKESTKEGARNKPPVRGQCTKTFEDLRARSSNNTEANLVTKSKKKSFKCRNRSGNANSQAQLKSNFGAQETRFGTKTENSKGYKRVQARNSSSRPVESYQALNREQKERLGKLLEAHLGIGL